MTIPGDNIFFSLRSALPVLPGTLTFLSPFSPSFPPDTHHSSPSLFPVWFFFFPPPLFPLPTCPWITALLSPLTDHPTFSRFHLVIWKCLLAKSLLQIHEALAQNAWKINSMYILGNLAHSWIFPLETVSKATERNHSQMRQSLSEKTCAAH